MIQPLLKEIRNAFLDVLKHICIYNPALKKCIQFVMLTLK